MVLAVNMPEHEPQPGQADCSISLSSSSVMVPALTEPTPSKMWFRSTGWPLNLPASMGPPLTKMAGTLSRTAAISMPGTILSQLGMKTRASKAWPSAMISTVSAMSSRLGRLYFMPAWFMAMPSQSAMVLNSNGTPPPARTPSLTASAIVRRWVWPGTTSVKLLTTPMKGLSISSRVQPSAYSSDRCGARSIPFLTASLFIDVLLAVTGLKKMPAPRDGPEDPRNNSYKPVV